MQTFIKPTDLQINLEKKFLREAPEILNWGVGYTTPTLGFAFVQKGQCLIGLRTFSLNLFLEAHKI
jgi:hypothetical protein